MITPQQQQQALSAISSSGVAGATTSGTPSSGGWYDALQQSAPQEAPQAPEGPAYHPLGSAMASIGSDLKGIGTTFSQNAAQQKSNASPFAKLGGEISAGADLAGKVTSLPFNAVGAALPPQIKQAMGTPVEAAAHAITNNPEALHALNTINSLTDAHPHVAQLLGGLGATALSIAGADTGGEGTIAAGAKAAEAGAGALDAAKAGIQGTADAVKNVTTDLPGGMSAARSTRIVNGRVNELTKLENSSAPLRRAVQEASGKGVDVKNIVANTDLLHGAVDKSGTIRTTLPGGAVEQLNDFIQPQENVISQALKGEGKTIPLSQLETQITDAVNNSAIKGGAKLRALNIAKQDIEGYKLDAVDQSGNPWVEGKSQGEPEIPLATVHDAKVDKYSNIDYANPESSKADKVIAKALKDTVEKNTSSVDVQALNKELGQHYQTLSYLEKLDGKKVNGGRLGKYFARTVGAVAGAHMGPLGAIAGAEGAGAVHGAMMSTKFGSKIGQELEMSPAMKEAVEAGDAASKAPVASPVAPQGKIGVGTVAAGALGATALAQGIQGLARGVEHAGNAPVNPDNRDPAFIMPSQPGQTTAPPGEASSDTPAAKGDFPAPSAHLAPVIDSVSHATGTNPAVLKTILLMESSMANDNTNQNSKVGRYAWLTGLTNTAKKDLAQSGYKADFNTREGALQATAHFWELLARRYPDASPADIYFKHYYAGPENDKNRRKQFASALEAYSQ